MPKKNKTSTRPENGNDSAANPLVPILAEGSPHKYRARVRMYRHGLGDCFLLTFPRKDREPFHMLIDCGVLARDKAFMTGIVQHIRDTVRAGKTDSKARLDVVAVTHEHKDHVSGFNQARDVFSNEFDFGAVWLSWTENLTEKEIKQIKTARVRATDRLRAALASPLGAAPAFEGVRDLLRFSEDDDTTGSGKVADAMEYLKLRGEDAGDLQFHKPGNTVELEGVDGVRVHVLGPPLDPGSLKRSEVTEKMKQEDVIYHMARTGEPGIDALGAAVGVFDAQPSDKERHFPFSVEHRITREVRDPVTATSTPNPYFSSIAKFAADTYDHPNAAWRRIDEAWLSALGQLALDLDSDTNNTSLVLAFEFKKGEVLLFVGDAQVGSWQSWGRLEFNVPGSQKPVTGEDLLKRTVFYKVGHHCSHNATMKEGGLEMMNRRDLVAFIPLDQKTADKQGSEGWEMPAPRLFERLNEKAGRRVVISDTDPPEEAIKAGVRFTSTYVDYFLI